MVLPFFWYAYACWLSVDTTRLFVMLPFFEPLSRWTLLHGVFQRRKGPLQPAETLDDLMAF